MLFSFISMRYLTLTLVWLSFLSLMSPATSYAQDKPALPFEVAWWPKKVRAGTVALVELKANAETLPEGISVCTGDQTIAFFDCSQPGKRAVKCGLVPVPYDRRAGKFPMQISWRQTETPRSETVSLPVVEGKYRVSELKVAPNLTKPSPEEQARIENERKDLAAVFDAAHPAPLWEGLFAMPAKGGVTSLFGNQRVFNGELNSVHLGVDLRAYTGVPIYSTNTGRVVAAKNFFSAGNMVVVDHGAGVFSSYAHLSKIKAEVGRMVKKGELVGLAGATGRVTGPHLHWAMRVAGVPVDPTQLMNVFKRVEKKTAFRASLSSAAGTRPR